MKKPKGATVQTLTLAPDEFLIVKFSSDTSTAMMRHFIDYLKEKFQTQRIVGFCGSTMKFAKIKLKEELIEKMILEDEIKL